MTICPYCSNPVKDTDKFCINCKKPLLYFASHKKEQANKSLQPEPFLQDEKEEFDINILVEDENIERKIQDVNNLLEERQTSGDPTGALLLTKASLYYKKRDLDTVSHILEIALSDFKNANDQVSIAICHNEMGLIQEELGFFDNAIYQFDRAIEILQNINDIDKLIKVYNNIANVYFIIDDLEHSYEFYQIAMKLAREENLIVDEVKTSSNLVDVLFHMNDYEFIKKLLDRNAFIFNQTNDINGY